MEQTQGFFSSLYIKTHLWTYTWIEKKGRPRAHKKWAKSPISMQIDGFVLLCMNKLETNLVFLQINFDSVSSHKTLSFGVFKIKIVQIHKNVVNTKPLDFEFKF